MQLACDMNHVGLLEIIILSDLGRYLLCSLIISILLSDVINAGFSGCSSKLSAEKRTLME